MGCEDVFVSACHDRRVPWQLHASRPSGRPAHSGAGFASAHAGLCGVLRKVEVMAASEQERATIIRLLSDTPNPVIVDVGAYIGDEYDWMKNVFPAMRYFGVEADPRNVAQFRERSPQARVIQAAIAAKTVPVEFHQCDNDIKQGIGSGSIRAPKKHLEFFPW